MKKVSVIIPTFGNNENPYRAVDSVFSQSYSNVEVIVVDDNGKNTDQQILNANIYSKYQCNPNFKYVVEDLNNGGSAARNFGVRCCTGDYVCFLDDDDEFSDSNKIMLQMKAADALDEAWAGTYSSLNIYNNNDVERIKAKQIGNFVAEFIKGNTSIGTAAPIISKTSFNKIGGFDESFIRHQDWEFFTRLLNEYKLFPVPDAYYNRYYKSNVKRKPADVRLEYMDHYVDIMQKTINIISRKKLNSLMKKKYVQVVFAFFREKRIREGFSVCKNKGYGFFDYCYLLFQVLVYFLKKI